MPVKQTFTDIDEHAAQMSGFDQEYVQLSRGAFQGVFSSVALPHGIGFDVEWVGQSLHQQARVPQQTVSLVTFLDLKGRAILNGCELNSADTFLLAPGTALDLRVPPSATIAVVTVPTHALDNAGPGGEPWARPRHGTDAMRLLDTPERSTLLAPVLLPMLQALETDTGLFADPMVSRSLADELLETVAVLIGDRSESGERSEPGSARRRRDVFLAARDAIDTTDSAELSVGKLCRITGVSRRTLETCFDEAVAMSPLQYLKIKRLNDVRRELVNASGAETTIGDVAARYGIWHLSRLAKEYGRLFGELPSATLRRGRSSAPARRLASTPRVPAASSPAG